MRNFVKGLLIIGGFLFVSSTVSAMLLDGSAIHKHENLGKKIDKDLIAITPKPVDMDPQEVIFDTIILQDDIVIGYTPDITPSTNSPPNVVALHL